MSAKDLFKFKLFKLKYLLFLNKKRTPKLPGEYKIYVRYEDKEITGSPFKCKVTGGEELTKQQLSKIKCSGAALKDGKVNVTNEIVVDTKESGVIGGLSVKMEG